MELTASTAGPPAAYQMARDRARRDDDALEQVEVGAEGVGDRRLDGVGVGHGHDGLARVAGDEPVEGADDAGLHLGERLAARGSGTRSGSAAPCCHSGSFVEVLELRAGPVAEVALEQAPVDLRPGGRAALAMGAAVSRVRSSGEA